jgi:hypothetical protein
MACAGFAAKRYFTVTPVAALNPLATISPML